MRLPIIILIAALLVSVGLAGCATYSDFALFNQPGGRDTGAVCGARSAAGTAPSSFVYYVTVTNQGAAGLVEVKYADGDAVRYPIPAGGSFSFSQAAGGTLKVDDLIQVHGVQGAVLLGSMSLTTSGSPHPDLAPSFCKTCPVGPCP